jgi:hypothetical protein
METIYLSGIYARNFKPMRKIMLHDLTEEGLIMFPVKLQDTENTIVEVKAIVDTGSNLNIIHPTLRDRIKSRDGNEMQGVTISSVESRMHTVQTDVNLICMGEKRSFPFIFTEIPQYQKLGVEVLIGSHFLKDYCELKYNILDDKFEFIIK